MGRCEVINARLMSPCLRGRRAVYRGTSMPALTGYFVPLPAYKGARARGCMTCAHWHGEFHSGHVVCRSRPQPQVIGRAELGCAYWMREPGADD